MSDEDDDESTTDSADAMRWAADEPTAMWDESLLQKEGFDALVKDRASNPREDTAPATVQQAGGAASTGSVEISGEATGSHPAVARGRQARRGMSWALTFALAVGLGFLVYALVRVLR